MSLIEFQICLDSLVYYAGQKITGRLVVQLTKAKRIRGIRVIYEGCGIVLWKRKSSQMKIKYEDAEKYLDLEQRVFGHGEDECELVAGRHVFAFYCQLPSNLPCSYKGKFGRIKYTVTARFDGDWRFNYNVKQPITILSVFDLNCLPIATAPVIETKSKKVGKQSQMLQMSFELPVRGFVPGQIIPIKVSLNNESMVRVKNIIASLRQNVMFRVDAAWNRSKVRLSKTQFDIDEGFGFHEAWLNIRVPALPPSYLEFCKIIDFRYHLRVEAKIETVRKNLKIDTEIFIGNIPVMMYQQPMASCQSFPELADSQNSSHVQSPAGQLSTPNFHQLAMYGNFSLPMYVQIMDLKPSKDSNLDLVYPVYEFEETKA